MTHMHFEEPYHTLLMMLGYDVQVVTAEWLAEPYTVLATVRNHDDDYKSIMLMPLTDDSEQNGQVIAAMFDVFSERLKILGYLMGFVGGCHESGTTELEIIRQRKEAAIMAQDFQLAADLRDQERAHVRD